MDRLVLQGGRSTTLTGLASAPESNAGKIFHGLPPLCRRGSLPLPRGRDRGRHDPRPRQRSAQREGGRRSSRSLPPRHHLWLREVGRVAAEFTGHQVPSSSSTSIPAGRDGPERGTSRRAGRRDREGCRSPAGGDRVCEGPRRFRRLRREESLHHAFGARPAARPCDRGTSFR